MLSVNSCLIWMYLFCFSSSLEGLDNEKAKATQGGKSEDLIIENRYFPACWIFCVKGLITPWEMLNVCSLAKFHDTLQCPLTLSLRGISIIPREASVSVSTMSDKLARLGVCAVFCLHGVYGRHMGDFPISVLHSRHAIKFSTHLMAAQLPSTDTWLPTIPRLVWLSLFQNHNSLGLIY